MSARVVILLSVAISAIPCGLLGADPAPTRPNIVVILIDDMGWGDFSCFGNTAVATEHVDRLAADVVDELRLVIAPRIAGRGRRLLDNLPSIQLESIRSEVSPTGYLLLEYRVGR